MQFKLTKSHRYWWPVIVRIPDPDNAGRFIEQNLKIQFEPKDRKAQIESQEAAAKLTSLRDIIANDVAEARAIIKNWEGVLDDDGEALPFSQERLDMALQQTWFRKGVQEALAQSMNGEEARLGN